MTNDNYEQGVFRASNSCAAISLGFGRSAEPVSGFVMSRMLSFILGLAVSGAVIAQPVMPETGHIISRPRAATIDKEGTQKGDAVRGTINEFGRCLVARNRRSALGLAATPSDSPAQARVLAKIVTHDCLAEGELRMPPSLVRGAVFRALYRAQYSRLAPSSFGQPIDWADGRAFDPTTSEGYAVVLRQFADCVVRRNPTSSRALTLAREQSTEERAALDTLRSDLAQCIPARAKIEFSKSTLFSLIAEVLYRNSVVSAGGR